MAEANTGAVVKMKPLSSEQLAVFCQQTHLLVQAGLGLAEGLTAMAEDTKEKPLKQLLLYLAQQLEQGESLAEALRQSGVFPPHLIQMVEIGATAGRLDAVLRSLSDYYQQEAEMLANVKSAVLYPALLLAMLLAVLGFLAAKVLPVFETVYQSLGAGLSGLAAGLLQIGAGIGHYAWVLVLLMVLVAATIIVLTKTSWGRRLCSRWLARGKLGRQFSAANLASALALMLESGLDPTEALALAREAVPNPVVQKQIDQCLQQVQNGQCGVTEALEQAGVFSASLNGVLAMGSRSGALAEVMSYTAQLYQKEWESGVAKRLSLLEPIAVAVLAVFIGAVLVSVMFPLLSIMATI